MNSPVGGAKTGSGVINWPAGIVDGASVPGNISGGPGKGNSIAGIVSIVDPPIGMPA